MHSFASAEAPLDPPQGKKENLNKYINTIDYSSEKARLEAGQTLDSKNICLDAYDLDNNFYAHIQQSTFYDREGNLTKLGEATRNGGFITQKFVDIEFKDFIDLGEVENFDGTPKPDQPIQLFWMKFVYILTKNKDYDPAEGPYSWPEWEVWDHNFTLSYKQFDIALMEAIAYITGPAALSFSGLSEDWTFKLSDIFKTLKCGVRLVYVMPHNINAFTQDELTNGPQKDIYEKFAMTTSHGPDKLKIVAKGAADAGALTSGDQLENLLIDVAAETPDILKEINSTKLYQIKEPVASSENIITSEVTVPQGDTGLDFIQRPKILKSFYMIPIPDATVYKNLEKLEELTHKEVSSLYNIWQNQLPGLGLPNFESSKTSAAFNTPIVELMGISSQKLVTELFERANVKVLNNYALSSTNLLNFAILQQAYFPYSNKFDLDDLFSASKELIDKAFDDSNKAKNDWSMDMDLSGWSKQVDLVMSAQVPDGAFFQWLVEVIPKFILRYLLAATDPCLKDAFDQQDENEWDDRKLPEIVFGSLFTKPENCSKEFDEIVSEIPGLEFALDILGISVPGDTTEEKKCLPGIRPTPIFPTGFPFFGDALRPITIPGLVYVALQFLVGSDQDLDSIDVPDVNIDPNISVDDICGPDSN